MGLHNDVSCCVITLYISFFLYIPGSDCFGCSIGVTTGSLIYCILFCWNVGDIKIELSNMYPRPIVCNKLIGLLIFFLHAAVYRYVLTMYRSQSLNCSEPDKNITSSDKKKISFYVIF